MERPSTTSGQIICHGKLLRLVLIDKHNALKMCLYFGLFQTRLVGYLIVGWLVDWLVGSLVT